MVEDVTTSGKSIDETYPLITGAANIEVKGLMVSLNRMEVGKGGVKCACDEVSEKYGFPTASIVNMAEEGKALYAAQLGRYAAALSEQWPEGRYFENGMSELAGYYYEGDARANVGVFFPDLDGDGSPEMVIGAILGADTDPTVLEIWTVKDGAPVMLAQSHARDKYYVEYLADENACLIANEGSGGAASSVWFYYALQNGELALMQGVTSESGAWYMTYDTDYDVSNDTPSDEAACQAIIDSHTERYTALDYTPYTELRQ